VAEHVLVRRLNAVGALTADFSDGVVHVYEADVVQSSDADVERAKRARPPDARTAVHHDWRSFRVSVPSDLLRPLRLCFSHEVDEMKHFGGDSGTP